MKRLLLIILGIGLILTSLIALTSSPTSLADKPGTATPDTGGGKPDKRGTPAPTPQTGAVYGYVYNYSNAAYVPGMTVVLDGGGWKAETVTTSDGYYSFAGLGSSSAVIQLKLPPGAHSVMPDYPVHTGSPDPGDTNVGFYWGENPPIPVILSVDKESVVASPGQAFELTVSVKNQSGGEATGGEIDVQLPGGLTVLKADTSHGKVDFTDHRVWGRLEALPDGETASLSLQVEFDDESAPQGESVQIIFTYNEQITPQLIRVNIAPSEGDEQSSAATSAAASDAASTEATTAQSADDAASTEADTEQSASEAAPTDSTAAQSADDTSSTEAAAEQTAADAASTETQAESEDLIPSTGGQAPPDPTSWISIILSVIFIVGLSFAGLRAFIKRGV